MLKTRSGHGSVSIVNKMFVISWNLSNSCEVYDSITNKFTLLKTNPHVNNIDCCLLKTFAITVGYKIHVFLNKESLERKRRVSTFCYDVIEKSWTSDDTSNIECLDGFSCAKMFKHWSLKMMEFLFFFFVHDYFMRWNFFIYVFLLLRNCFILFNT